MSGGKVIFVWGLRDATFLECMYYDIIKKNIRGKGIAPLPNPNKTRNTMSNAHKMIPPVPHVLYGKVLVLLCENPKIIRIKF